MRYHKPLVQMPSVCDGCGAEFSVDHGLNCPKGGNVIERHNEIRDVTGQLASMAFSHVTSEPVVREASTARGERDHCGLVCDLAVRGVWHPQTEALFDFRVCNADAQSYANRPVTAVLDSLAQAKTTKHAQACRQRRADFTPFIVTTDGVIQREGQHFLRCLASRLANKWSKSYSTTMSFVSTQLSLAILRATGHCLRRPQEDVAPSVWRWCSNVTLLRLKCQEGARLSWPLKLSCPVFFSLVSLVWFFLFIYFFILFYFIFYSYYYYYFLFFIFYFLIFYSLLFYFIFLIYLLFFYSFICLFICIFNIGCASMVCVLLHLCVLSIKLVLFSKK